MTTIRRMIARGAVRWLLLLCSSVSVHALDPHRPIQLYSQATWTQQDGLPEGAVRAISQTTDGYLWIGTDDGLARFDGYEFKVFRATSGLPSHSITSLAADHDGSLWIGTPNGLSHFTSGRFKAYTIKDGLPDDSIRHVFVTRNNEVWVTAGGNLSRFVRGTFTNYLRGQGLPMRVARQVTESSAGVLYAVGNRAIVRLEAGRFQDATRVESSLETPIAVDGDSHAGVWVLSSHGLVELAAGAAPRQYTSPSIELQAVLADRDSSIWLGTNAGLARLENGHVHLAPNPSGSGLGPVWSLFEDRDGNLWVGSANGLTRFREEPFSVHGRATGLPSDEPNALTQDRNGRVWVGFLDHGVAVFPPDKPEAFLSVLKEGRIFSIRETAGGDMLIAGREGLFRVREGRVMPLPFPDPLGRRRVFDAIEDKAGTIWLALPAGLGEWTKGELRIAIPAGPLLQEDAFSTLAIDADGAIWAGTLRKGLWRYQNGVARHFTARDGLASDEIRALRPSADGRSLWIGTIGGGLAQFRDGKFTSYGIKQGILSENIVQIVEDVGSLWLGSTHGVSRVSTQELDALRRGALAVLQPLNFGVAERRAVGRSSAEIGSSAFLSRQGTIWFASTQGISVLDPRFQPKTLAEPALHVLELSADNRHFDTSSFVKVPAGSGRIQIRYAAIHLPSPQRVSYSYRLQGVDANWVEAGNQRTADYNSLAPGRHRFLVRAQVPDGPPWETTYEFEILPHFYQANWFRGLSVVAVLALLWLGYRYREDQVRLRYAAVLDERARLSREVHDTLAQGFVGIAAQLDAAEMRFPDDPAQAHANLDVARRMARHSLTEARRSVEDLRASALDDQDLAQALRLGLQQWTEGSPLRSELTVTGSTGELPGTIAHQVLRVAQEAVANVIKHAHANRVDLRLQVADNRLHLHITDDGRGFEGADPFRSPRGHFGLIGMRERVKRMGGIIQLQTAPGLGTTVNVAIPLKHSEPKK